MLKGHGIFLKHISMNRILFICFQTFSSALISCAVVHVSVHTVGSSFTEVSLMCSLDQSACQMQKHFNFYFLFFLLDIDSREYGCIGK